MAIHEGFMPGDQCDGGFIICPWCGYEYGDAWEWDEDGEHDCDECQKPFNFHRAESVDFCTEQTGDDASG